MQNITLTPNEEKIKNGEQFANATTLFDPVEKTALLFPNNVALRFMGKNIRYAQLRKQIRRYGDALRAAGLSGGEAVTFALPNIPESVYLLYGAAYAGLRASPVHPLAAPQAIATAMQKTGSRMAFVLSDAAKVVASACPFATVIAVSPAHALPVKNKLYCLKHPMPRSQDNLVRLDDFLRKPEKTRLFAKKECAASEKTAILLQSGGTTGTPKVIGLSAQAVHNLAKRGLGILGKSRGTDCGMLSVLPVFHGFGLAMGVHAMLCHGGKNVLFPKFHRASAVKEIRRGNVQFIIGVPRLYEALLSHPKFNGNCLQKLFVAFVGGDFVSHSLLKKFDAHIAAAGGTCRLFEGYGLTETVTVCSVNTFAAHRDETVGKPLQGITVRAFDFSVDPPVPLPPEQKGELAVAGDTLMEEYLADADATNAVFFTHDGKRYVRTGDCGYVDADDFVHFVSRYKRIIKIKGIPVYPQEIEQLCVAQKGISDACAVPVKGEGDEQKIVLFIESTDQSLTETLHALIRDTVSAYADPYRIIAVKQFPLTNVSKINTQKLIETYYRD